MCPTFCDPKDCNPPGSSANGISQARILEWVAIFFSRGSSWPKDQTHVSHTGRWVLYHGANRKPVNYHSWWKNPKLNKTHPKTQTHFRRLEIKSNKQLLKHDSDFHKNPKDLNHKWWFKKKKNSTHSLAVPWLRLGAFTAEALGSIPGWRTKILKAALAVQPKKKKPQDIPSESGVRYG